MSDQQEPSAPRVGERPLNMLVERTKPFWSAEHVTAVLDLGGYSELERAVANGAILGLRTSDGPLVFPVWQFCKMSNDLVAVHPGLLPVLVALRNHGSWAVATWLRAPSPEIGGRTALEVAVEGDDEEALHKLVKEVDREWSAGSYPKKSDVEAVLDGRMPYDDIGAVDQALVRAEWDRRIEVARARCDLEAQFGAQGRSWSEIDSKGRIVRRNACTGGTP